MELNCYRTSVLLLILIGYLSVEVVCQSESCSSAITCGQCYARIGCAWCSAAGFSGDRCFSNTSIPSTCTMIENTQGNITIDELELNSDNQISVQRATLEMRTGTTQTVSVSIRPAENFPLDLYMLVDLSMSLRDDLDTIKSIATDITDTIRNISTRFQVGFGTFVDKLTPPYVSKFQIRGFNFTSGNITYTDNCADNVRCQLPFSYVHNVNLTNNSAMFSNGFQNLLISTNVDKPEGTFDAMLQAALCDEVVGWRRNARKIILIITDDIVHTAGDGKLAGIVRPVPSECLTVLDPATGQMTYRDNLKYDYPSVEQLRQAFSDNIIVPIFAVTSPFLGLYQTIANSMAGTGAVTAAISANSSNIIDVIQTAYENIISNVTLSFRSANGIRINYEADCPVGSTRSSNGQSCFNVTINQTITFNIDVTLEQCLSDKITVNVPAYGSFEIEVNGICTCDCASDAIQDSDQCSNNGTLSCGVCECTEEWTGDTCNCAVSAVSSLECLMFGGQQCNGRGDCECGVCQCRTPEFVKASDDPSDTRYNVTGSDTPGLVILEGAIPMRFGNACECDNYLCDYNRDTLIVCSGATNGRCTCNDGNYRCQCLNDTFLNIPYTGVRCECSEVYCYDRSVNSTRPCSGRGTCQPCDRDRPCTCDDGYLGTYCSVRFNSSAQQCESVNYDCIICVASSTNITESCRQCNVTGNILYFRLDGPRDESYNIPGSFNDTMPCSYVVPDPLCTYHYFIALSSSDLATRLVYVQPEQGCLLLHWWAIALILLAVLIIIGIVILVVIKLIFMCLDYAELKKFQKEVDQADLSKNFNPLYQSPDVKYTNVAFGKE